MSLPKDAYLAHHGILGQKWGKRNGPPYPLGMNDHSASEKKAGWKKSLSGNGADAKNEKPSSKENIDPKTGLKLKTREYSEEEDQNAINNSIWEVLKPIKNNCMFCTTAYELRRRGYDVKANKSSHGYDVTTIKEFFPKAKLEALYQPSGKKQLGLSTARANLGINKELTKSVVEGLKKQGDGARGNLLVRFDDYAGHSVAYEVKKGKVILRDCQVGITYEEGQKSPLGLGKDDMNLFLDGCITAHAIRTDNLDFDAKKIKEAVQ